VAGSGAKADCIGTSGLSLASAGGVAPLDGGAAAKMMSRTHCTTYAMDLPVSFTIAERRSLSCSASASRSPSTDSANARAHGACTPVLAGAVTGEAAEEGEVVWAEWEEWEEEAEAEVDGTCKEEEEEEVEDAEAEAVEDEEAEAEEEVEVAV
jgi:hypothetical protein